jgi:hypothetical protein
VLRGNDNTVNSKKQGRKKSFQNKTAEGISALQPYNLNYAALQMAALLLRLFQCRLVLRVVLQPLFKTANRLAETLAERGSLLGPKITRAMIRTTTISGNQVHPCFAPFYIKYRQVKTKSISQTQSSQRKVMQTH